MHCRSARHKNVMGCRSQRCRLAISTFMQFAEFQVASPNSGARRRVSPSISTSTVTPDWDMAAQPEPDPGCTQARALVKALARGTGRAREQAQARGRRQAALIPARARRPSMAQGPVPALAPDSARLDEPGPRPIPRRERWTA